MYTRLIYPDAFSFRIIYAIVVLHDFHTAAWRRGVEEFTRKYGQDASRQA